MASRNHHEISKKMERANGNFSSSSEDNVISRFNRELSKTRSDLSDDAGGPVTNGNSLREISSYEFSEDSNQPDTIMCIFWKFGKLGCAYFKIGDHQVSDFIFVLNN